MVRESLIRRKTMAEGNIAWRHSLEAARREARETGKLVLIDLFSPQ
jgi:hypothetical protein